MELEVNKSHKKIDLSHIKKPLVRFTAGALVSLCIFSGMANTNAKSEVVIPEPAPVEITDVVTEPIQYTEEITYNSEQEVNVPENYRFNILFQVNKTEEDVITTTDLEKIEYLNISISDDTDLSFLEYCTNLKDLQVTCLDKEAITYLSKLPVISNLESLSIYNMFLPLELNKENSVFLDNNPSIKYLELDGILLIPGVEEKLNTLETLRLGPSENIDIDFSKLNNLKTLDVSELEPYTLAMHFNSEEYNFLINSGVNIVFSEQDKDKYLSANEKLDEIVSNLNVTKENTDREKLDAILLYTLKNYTYDPTIAKLSPEELANTNLAAEFYKDGLLYGALEMDTAICGNYTAIVEALSDRLGSPTDSFYMTSNEHAWNLMNIDGDIYYVDSTWLDDFEFMSVPAIEEGRGENIDWYMESPDFLNIISKDPNGAHVPVVTVPDYMKGSPTIHNIDYEKKENQVLASSSKVTIKVNDERVETSLGSIIGAMAAFGLAVAVTDKKNKKTKENDENKHQKK